MAVTHMSTERIDADYCYARDDQYQLALYLDYSVIHQITVSQTRDLENTLRASFENLPPNGKISIFSSSKDETSTVMQSGFTLCRPSATVEEQEDLGAPNKSAAMLRREFQEAEDAFLSYVVETLEHSKDETNKADSSPILEQIQGISRASFSSPLSKLIIFSDGVNNSENGRFCSVQGDLPPYRLFKEQPRFRYIRPDSFSGAEIDFLMVQDGRTSPSDMAYCTWLELQNFWVDYFEDNGGRNVTLTPLGVGAAH